MNPRRSTLSIVMVLALALGAAAFGCGPQKKFCPDTVNTPLKGNCPEPVDSAVDDAGMDLTPKETGSITVSDDAAGN